MALGPIALLISTALVLQTVATVTVFPASELTPPLFVLRTVHIAANLLVVLYPLLFDRACDATFLIVWLLLAASWWLLRGECALTYLEKRLLDPGYVLGDDPQRHPYMRHVFTRPDGTEHPLSLVLPVGMHVTLLFVATRYASTLPLPAAACLVVPVTVYVTATVLACVSRFFAFNPGA